MPARSPCLEDETFKARLSNIIEAPEFLCNEAIAIRWEGACGVGGVEIARGEEICFDALEADMEWLWDYHDEAIEEVLIPWLGSNTSVGSRYVEDIKSRLATEDIWRMAAVDWSVREAIRDGARYALDCSQHTLFPSIA